MQGTNERQSPRASRRFARRQQRRGLAGCQRGATRSQHIPQGRRASARAARPAPSASAAACSGPTASCAAGSTRSEASRHTHTHAANESCRRGPSRGHNAVQQLMHQHGDSMWRARAPLCGARHNTHVEAGEAHSRALYSHEQRAVLRHLSGCAGGEGDPTFTMQGTSRRDRALTGARPSAPGSVSRSHSPHLPTR